MNFNKTKICYEIYQKYHQPFERNKLLYFPDYFNLLPLQLIVY